MQTNSSFQLSDYQRAILNEMDISCWALVSEKPDEISEEQKGASVEREKLEVLPLSSEPVSKDSALAKLAALKQVKASAESTDKVLLAISGELPFIQDVLLTIGVDDMQTMFVDEEKIPRFIDFPFAWKHDDHINLQDNVLTTPALTEMNNVKSKKQLWQALQLFINKQ